MLILPGLDIIMEFNNVNNITKKQLLNTYKNREGELTAEIIASALPAPTEHLSSAEVSEGALTGLRGLWSGIMAKREKTEVKEISYPIGLTEDQARTISKDEVLTKLLNDSIPIVKRINLVIKKCEGERPFSLNQVQMIEERKKAPLKNQEDVLKWAIRRYVSFHHIGGLENRDYLDQKKNGEWIYGPEAEAVWGWIKHGGRALKRVGGGGRTNRKRRTNQKRRTNRKQ